MSSEELIYLENIFKNMDLTKIHKSYHAKNNGISAELKYIQYVLYKDNIKDLIIEYNETPTKNGIERRVLIRDNEEIVVEYNSDTEGKFIEKSNLCFVICIDTCKIVTTYYNTSNDSHNTLNLNRYSQNLNIIR